MEPPVLVLKQTPTRTRILLMEGPDELLRAILPGSRAGLHNEAARMLLEGLALWLDRRLHVVLSADDLETSSCLGLTDAFGLGHRNLFFTVEVLDRPASHRLGRRIRGLGNFGELRKLHRLGSRVGGP
jgi:hypothetical protein